MPNTHTETFTALSHEALRTFDNLSGGAHPGYRPTHAKGVLLTGRFTPSPSALNLSRAPHLQRASTPISVRFSDFGGIPNIPDADPNAAPRGMAIRFHLAEHVHTDIVAHSEDGFPTRTAEEFIEFLAAIAASGPGSPKPSAIEQFLATHPAALKFVKDPKPVPTSYARENYFAVNAYRFTNERGVVRHGRYRIVPEAGTEYLEAGADAAPNFLLDEIQGRLKNAPARFSILVQVAAPGDIVDDSTVRWPDDREQIQFGTLEIDAIADNNAQEQQHIIFDPIPRVDGIEPSDDPLLQPRADLYLLSGRRRRTGAAGASA